MTTTSRSCIWSARLAPGAISDVAFQSPNVEATTPLVFSTALLLLLVVTAMNLTAHVVRARLRRRLRTSGV